MLRVTGRKQVPVYPLPPRLEASNRQHIHPLGMLAQLHIHSLFKRLRHRQRYPHLPCPRVPRGSPPRDAHVLPADGMHVAVRQLEQWPFRGKDYRMECPGLCSCVCRRLWNVSYSCWDVWDCCWGYQGFQGDERGGGLVVCRQLQLCIRYVFYRQRSYITRSRGKDWSRLL